MTDLLQTDPRAVILAEDEAHLWAQSKPHVVWSPVGQPPTLTVSPQRNRVVFYGALNLRTGHEHAIMTEKMNRPTTLAFLDFLATLYPGRTILLIVDRASWHKGTPVDDWLIAHPNVHLFFLPTACPDLNPQEHVWAAARRTVSTAQPFSRLADAFLSALRSIRFRPTLFEHYAPPIISSLTG